ncbi:hypothetical protein VaNZ11_002939 [Volvox africanus]|uniref:Uncharacterized protein n=1 Tax=Volvox africanus TaxID=51714 RepID=A0ABQ5RTB5_9CHLO|nr:hypothetical protein VaNZ11_002939 [Volvox africanus]
MLATQSCSWPPDVQDFPRNALYLSDHQPSQSSQPRTHQKLIQQAFCILSAAAMGSPSAAALSHDTDSTNRGAGKGALTSGDWTPVDERSWRRCAKIGCTRGSGRMVPSASNPREHCQSAKADRIPSMKGGASRVLD